MNGQEIGVLIAKRYGWKAVTIALGTLAGVATQRVLEVPWKALRGSTPPKVQADRRSSWAEALSWAVATGVGVGLARLVAVRTAATVWDATVHEPPPEPALAGRSPH
jgi:Protein of unknown function (DUF4235)